MNTEGKSELKGGTVASPGNGEQEQAGSANDPQTAANAELPVAEPLAIEAAELEDLKAEAAKAKEYWEMLLRKAAELDNFKKRAARERHDAIKYANESLLERLVPVLDNLEAALAASSSSAPAEAMQSFQTGMTMIHQQLKKGLTDAGLEEIDATNQPFDPNVHEALMQQETDKAPEGQVIQQLRKGYKLRDRLIRPAGVVVAKAPAN